MDEERCASHPERSADGVCARCGSFACTDCVAFERSNGDRICKQCIVALGRPFRPHTIGVLSFFFGFPSGALLHAMNEMRFGESRRALLPFAGYCVLFTVFIVVIGMLPEGIGQMAGLGINIGCAVHFGGARAKEFAAFVAAGGQHDSGWKALAIALGMLVAIFALAFVVLVAVDLPIPGALEE
jgi:hypothetical protein